MQLSLIKNKLFFIFFISSNLLYSQNNIGANYYQGDSLLNVLLNKYDSEIGSLYKMEYKGKEYMSGHFKTPETIEICSLFVMSSFDDNQNFSLEFKINYKNQDYYSKLKWTDGYCSFLDFGETDYKKDTSNQHIIPYYYSIYNLLHNLLKNKTTIHYTNLLSNNRSVIGFNDKKGNKVYLYINNSNNNIEKVDNYYYDATLGDCKESIEYSFKSDSIDSITHFKNDNIFRVLKVNNKEKTSCHLEGFNASSPFELDSIATNIYLVSLLDIDNKVLVAVSDSYISVFEAPVNPEITKELIFFIQKQFQLPIKYCYLSHHHPDHAGGVKSFGELEDCTIVTSKNTFNYISSLIHSKHSFKNYKNQNNIKDFKSILVENQQIVYLGDKTIPIVAYEIGETTNHTDDFIVYHLPKQNILITSDLLYLPKNKVTNQGERALSIHTLIKKNNINTLDLKLIPLWPLHGFKNVGSYLDLVQSLKSKYPNIE